MSACFASFQLSAALDYLLVNAVHEVEICALEKACGVGVVVTADEIEDTVSLSFMVPFLCFIDVYA